MSDDFTCTNCGEYVGSPITDKIEELEAAVKWQRDRAEAAEASDAESIAMYHRARDRAEAAEAERDRLRIMSGNLLDVLKGAHIDFYHHCDADDFYAARAALRNGEAGDG